MTLRQIFDKYPLMISKVAKDLDMNRRQLSYIINGGYVSEEKLKQIEIKLQEYGLQLSEIKVTK